MTHEQNDRIIVSPTQQGGPCPLDVGEPMTCVEGLPIIESPTSKGGGPPIRGGGAPIHRAWFLLAPLAAILCCGCPVTQSLPDQASIMDRVEKRSGCSYQLYVPSIYDDRRPWPLIVVCHGTWPWDSAESQMREWAKFAEYEGIIVAAPRLVSSKGDWPPPPEKQIALQEEDEWKILAMVSQIKRRQNIAESQVFLTGWSAGAYPILHTGLRNPDVFRALFIRQGTFDERFMDVPDEVISKWQPVKIVYGKSDTLRDQTTASVDWLEKAGVWVDREELPGIHRRIDPKHAWRYFSEVIKDRLWVRIRTHRPDAARPLAIRFDLDCIPEAVKQKWLFGDGDESYDASPVHAYKEPGRYEVRVNLAIKGGKKYTRTKTIRVTRSSPPA